MIELYSAVDILGGRAVRLERGDFGRRRTYDAEPLAAARRWVEAGTRRLHVVDLDGARQGRPVSLDHLRAIAGELDVPIQYGGGLRSVEAAMAALAAGAMRLVVGTAAVSGSSVLDEMLERCGEQVAIAIDVRDGHVSTEGWLARTEMHAADAIAALRERGVRIFVFTNIDVDGTLAGLDAEAVVQASQAVGDGRLIYSGGIGSVEDLRALTQLSLVNLEGVIVGKALYEGCFTVAEARAALGASGA